ncbi:hypothetical protein TMatcc_010007 [Talaromyces marneffei ATCC 18224]|uniref:Uncharacterized protein n=2 Tax=Talaromyces marneffei TaxID=37727 RepID=B6QTY6_TALMQ|nr:uncharacterized protein EYB26_009222 [Talaromyces marneffei]EEA19865.1 conserved hypothetical protein [Talaromyces marneffei ATCC 18224]KAE8548164.1 hypothetical protein EYB25_009958 [Talaromyces marneffei]QGA21511.1 hypothetical protein EYB26_009222 [Talaromyces marneffei]
MKAFTFVALAAIAGAQQIWLQAPGLNQEVTAGGDLVIEIQSQDAASPYTDIAAAIGIEPWSTGYVDTVELGQWLLYQGNWSIEGFAYPQGGLYTNVTVSVPSNLPVGPALLSVAVFQVVGASNEPYVQKANVNVTVVSSS